MKETGKTMQTRPPRLKITAPDQEGTAAHSNPNAAARHAVDSPLAVQFLEP